MAIKKNSIIVSMTLLGFLSLHFQCNKRLGCEENLYNFEISIKAFPDKDSINVGDTIILEINAPTTLKDVQTGRMIDYSGASNLGSVINFHQLSPINQFTINSAEKFSYFLIKGTEINSINPLSAKEYRFIQEGQSYLFKLGIIPRQSGTYRLGFSNAANVYRENDNCSKASFVLNFKNTDQHYYISPTYQGGTLVGGDYYFKVN